MKLTPSFSGYLDFLRFGAALAVLLGHMDQDGVSMDWMPLALFSHDAVVVFFVLSGFIIYHSTVSRSTTWQQYAAARLSRIYSVALPAVLACIALAFWLSDRPGFHPEALSNYSAPSVWHAVSSLLFLNESWLNASTVTLNHPYWSLCYEVWYYVLFGVFMFAKGRWRWTLLAMAGLIAGPAILVLLPVWAMGAWLAATRRHESRWPPLWAWAAFLLPVVLIVVIKLTDTDKDLRLLLSQNVPGFWRLDSSQRFVTDYLIGAVLCVHLAAFSSLPKGFQDLFERHKVLLMQLSGFSFTLYLFHRPMTQLLGVHHPLPHGPVWQAGLFAMAIVAACWVISWGTEKQLGRWRRAFSRVLESPRVS